MIGPNWLVRYDRATQRMAVKALAELPADADPEVAKALAANAAPFVPFVRKQTKMRHKRGALRRAYLKVIKQAKAAAAAE